MTLLAIDTATRLMGVTILEGERLLASYELVAENPHAVELAGAVARMLQAAHTTLDQVEAIVVDIGPGSFTGLRIGLAFAKALAFRRKTPLVSVPSLEVLAANVPYAAQPVCVLLDAKQKNLYAARFHLEAGTPVKETDCLLGPAEEMIRQVAVPGAIVLGDGCAVYRDALTRLCPTATIAPQELWLPRAATLARLGRARWQAGQRDDPATLVPLYLYPLDCSVRGPDRSSSVLPGDRQKLEELRALRGQAPLTTDIDRSRGRRGSPPVTPSHPL